MGQAAQPISSGFFLLPESLFAKAISIPNTKKPPGGRINTIMGSMTPWKIGTPNTAPVPKNSRIIPMASMAAVKPTPMPKPSKTEGRTLCLLAYISARPRIMQFTTIRGR